MSAARRRAGRALFVDSSGFFAAANRHDPNHAAARRTLDRAAHESTILVSTNYIIAEAHALFLSKAGREAGVRFLRSIEGSALRVVRATAEDEASARAIVFRYTDKEFSLTDAISFAVMERLRISTALSFDHDFQRYGFTLADD